uniref:Uncharacterized protein n=1 Tax=Myoviridae sp. ctJ2i1 TaxID=2825079 RepID=A0A8S5V1Q1_9CAUD|nr:MAG TPA: hypothetical protein [Myoviridae sp. ctJ2i1]
MSHGAGLPPAGHLRYFMLFKFSYCTRICPLSLVFAGTYIRILHCFYQNILKI